MSSTVRGVVQRTFEKPMGNGTLHSFTLKGQDGFFGTGFRKPPIEAGKSYEFEYDIDPKGRKNVNLSTLRPWESGAEMAGESVRGLVNRGGFKGSGFKGDPEKDQYWKNKELRDIQNDKMRELGATRNTALTLVQLMLANGAVKLPAKEAAREEVIFQLFEHYTDTLLKGKDVADPIEPEVTTAEQSSEAEDASWK